MTLRTAIVAAIAVVVAAGGAGAYFALRSSGGGVADGGPLAPPSDAGYSSGSIPLDPKQVAAFGLLVVSNRDKGPATLDRVELVEPTPGMKIVASYAQPTNIGSEIGLLVGFPPPGAGPGRRPVAGFRVPPGGETRVVLGVAVAAPGSYVARKVRLYYRAHGKRFRTDWPVGLRLCAPQTKWFGRCPAPRG